MCAQMLVDILAKTLVLAHAILLARVVATVVVLVHVVAHHVKDIAPEIVVLLAVSFAKVGVMAVANMVVEQVVQVRAVLLVKVHAKTFVVLVVLIHVGAVQDSCSILMLQRHICLSDPIERKTICRKLKPLLIRCYLST